VSLARILDPIIPLSDSPFPALQCGQVIEHFEYRLVAVLISERRVRWYPSSSHKRRALTRKRAVLTRVGLPNYLIDMTHVVITHSVVNGSMRHEEFG